MEAIKNISTGIIRLFIESIKDMRENHKIANHPTEYSREFLKKAEMHYLSDLDTKCIWQNNRFIPDRLIQGLCEKEFFRQFFTANTETRTIPIRNITQISASKSADKPCEWTNIADFGKETYERGDIRLKDDIEGLIRRILRGKEAIEVYHYDWSGEYLWKNCDGSHHFGIAYHHAVNGEPIQIPATITTYSFNKEAYSEFCNQNSLWVMNEETYRRAIVDLGWKVRYGFHNEKFSYPMKDAKNVIVRISEDHIGLGRLLYDYGLYIKPFSNLFLL